MLIGGVSLLRPGELRHFIWRHPEAVPAFVIGLAWLVLVSKGTRLTMSPQMGSGTPVEPDTSSRLASVLNGVPGWTLMVVAMMGPSALAGLRHTALNSLPWRRGRAMIEYATAYLAVWVVFGLPALSAAAFLQGFQRWIIVATILVVAAVWQFTRLKLKALRDCHRAIALPPRGKIAELATLRFGLRQGSACVRSCWCVMLTMTAVPDAHVAWTAVLAVVLTAERFAERPKTAVRLVALTLLTVGVAVALVSAGS
jgi:predicted metal-binding membrane protein